MRLPSSMAGGESSNRDLWQSITGGSVLRPPELIEDELKRNREKLIKCLEHYKPAGKKTPGEDLKKEKKIQGVRFDFALKISKFLNLDEVQSYELFCSYLLHDYRGSRKDLQMLLGVDRHAQALLLKVRDYYFTERLYLLRCIKHLLSYWQEGNHPYVDKYADFVEEASKSDKLSKGIMKQYLDSCEVAAPTWETHGQTMNERQATVWMNQTLKEQCELLEILLLFYRTFEHQAGNLLTLAKEFKKQGFGKRQTNKHLLEESSETVVKRIGYLQVVLLIEGMDLEYLHNCNENEEFKNHHIISSKEYKDLNQLFATFGDIQPHGPVLLTWTLIRQLDMPEDGALTQRMGNAALHLKTFQYLFTLLDTEPFNGQTMIATVCQTVLNGLMALVLQVYHEDTLGDSQILYSLVAKLLEQPFNSDDFWQQDSDEGIRSLLKSSLCQFPLRFEQLIKLMTALSKASTESAQKVYALLQHLRLYTEYLDNNHARNLMATKEEDIWKLAVEKRPYNNGPLSLAAGSLGRLDPNPVLSLEYSGKHKNGALIVHWSAVYDGWKLCECEVLHLQEQISHGAGTVTAQAISRVTQIAELAEAVMVSCPSLTLKLKGITSHLPFVIERFSVVQPPPLNLLSQCVQALTYAALQDPTQVWHQLKQTRLLPYMTENFDDYHEAASGSGLNAGAFGSLLAGYECTQGAYPLTVSILKLVASLIQPLHKLGKLEELMASVVFITREIFPAFHKWRYYSVGTRELIGQKCLEIFHKILNILDSSSEGKRIHLRDVCVHCLLYTESGRALLDIVSTGVDVVETTLAQQGSAMEGLGVEVIQLIRLSLSVLNRLLLLRPADAPPSPVEHALSAKPANYTHRHVVAVIAQYIYHRHDPRLPTLATLLLKRLAMVFPMSILACLGNDAEPIRDMYLARLQANTEDIRLKVVLLEFLAICVEMQPGLTEMFLNVQSVKKKDGKTDIAVGRTSCLQTVLNLIDEKKQGTYQCPYDLLCAAMEFLHSLWEGQREAVMAILRERETFWRSVCLSLMRDLPQMNEEDISHDVVDREIKTCARIISILGHEMYGVPSDKLDKNLKKVLTEFSTEKRIQYWSGYLSENMRISCQCPAPEIVSDSPTLQLLMAWRNFMLVMASYKPECLKLSSEVKVKILKDILDGLEAQFSNGMTRLSISLASVASAFYFTQLKHWIREISDPNEVVQQLQRILSLTCTNSETLIPSVQIGILGALAILLQHNRINKNKDLDKQRVNQLVPVVCAVLQQSTYQLPLASKADTNDKIIAVKLKLQTVTVCLVQELVLSCEGTDVWLTELKHHTILPSLLASLQAWIQVKKAASYVHAVMIFFIALAKIPQAAEALAVNGLTRHLCLVMSLLYEEQTHSIASGSPAKKVKRSQPSAWHEIYCLGLSLVTLMLSSLRYNFLQEALDFVGVHQDRMYQCLESLRSQLAPSCLEEVEQTCLFLHQMSHYEREWRLHLPEVLQKLKASVCYLAQSCVSMLIRPRLLTHMMQKQSGKEPPTILTPDQLRISPAARQFSQQSSSDDSEGATPELLRNQERVLEILSYCLATMRQFSPNLREILLDQSMDVGEYEPILLIGFSTPSMDQDSPPTFGTLVACVNTCLRLLAKLEPRSTSPLKSPQGEMPIKRASVMFVLESALHLILSQAVRYLREASLPPRDKQLLRRELSAELVPDIYGKSKSISYLQMPCRHSSPRHQQNSFLMSMQRHLRRGPTSPAAGSQHAVKASASQITFTQNQEHGFFRLVDNFVQNVLK